jgi:hypothetical protein
MTDISITTAPERRERRFDKPKLPYREQVRGFRMHDDNREQ